MKSLLLLTVAILVPIAMSAQTAKVQSLTPAEAAEAKSLYQQKADIDKKIADFRDSLVKEYIRTKNGKEADPMGYAYGGPDGVYYFRTGWRGNDFLFSDDFKYIVPAPSLGPPCTISGESISNCTISGSGGAFVPTPAYLNGGGVTLTPAFTSGTDDVYRVPPGTHFDSKGNLESNN